MDQIFAEIGKALAGFFGSPVVQFVIYSIAVYLVGGGTHPGSGLPVIFESARISTRLLLADLGIAPAGFAAEPQLASLNLETA